MSNTSFNPIRPHSLEQSDDEDVEVGFEDIRSGPVEAERPGPSSAP